MIRAVLILALMFPSVIWAQSPPPPKPVAAERLVMPLFPAGWNMVTNNQASDVEVVEYVPDGESPNLWREKITLQIFHGLNSLPLDAIHNRARTSHFDACAVGPIGGTLQMGDSNGYLSAFWTLGCQRNKQSGNGETIYAKAVQGVNTLYVISRMWRTPPFSGEGPPITAGSIQDGLAFLTTTVICDDGNPAHPCP